MEIKIKPSWGYVIIKGIIHAKHLEQYPKYMQNTYCCVYSRIVDLNKIFVSFGVTRSGKQSLYGWSISLHTPRKCVEALSIQPVQLNTCLEHSQGKDRGNMKQGMVNRERKRSWAFRDLSGNQERNHLNSSTHLNLRWLSTDLLWIIYLGLEWWRE